VSEKEDRMDFHIMAERIANLVNKKLSALDQRMTNLESKIKKLELDVETIRMQTIETIIRSVLNVKTDDITSAVAVKLSSEFSKSAGLLSSIAEDLKVTIEDLRKEIRDLGSLRDLPSEITERIKKLKVSADIDTTKLEASINVPISRSLKAIESLLSRRVADLDKRLNELSQHVSKLNEALSALGTIASKIESMSKTIENMQESVSYVREVTSIIEEKLKQRSSKEGGEEEE